MQIDVIAPSELDAKAASLWAQFQAQAGLLSPFFSAAWVEACAQVDGPDRRHARIAVLREGRQTVGFFPARVKGGTAMPVGAPMCDYQGVIARPGLTYHPRQLVRALHVGRLDFASLMEDQASFQRFIRGRHDAQVIDLSAGYDAYAAQRRESGAGVLQDAAKKRRKLEREHGTVVFTALSREQADFDQLIGWKRAQYAASGQTDIFGAGWTQPLLQYLFDQGSPSFGGALFTLHVGDTLAAAHFALRQDGVLHAWFIAHSEAFARYSPGLVLIDDMLRWCGRNGVQELDLGPGDARFKQSLANVQRGVAHGYVGRPSPAAVLREAAYRVRTAAEALPLGRYSALPGKAMRRLDLIRGLS